MSSLRTYVCSWATFIVPYASRHVDHGDYREQGHGFHPCIKPRIATQHVAAMAERSVVVLVPVAQVEPVKMSKRGHRVEPKVVAVVRGVRCALV